MEVMIFCSLQLVIIEQGTSGIDSMFGLCLNTKNVGYTQVKKHLSQNITEVTQKPSRFEHLTLLGIYYYSYPYMRRYTISRILSIRQSIVSLSLARMSILAAGPV